MVKVSYSQPMAVVVFWAAVIRLECVEVVFRSARFGLCSDFVEERVLSTKFDLYHFMELFSFGMAEVAAGRWG